MQVAVLGMVALLLVLGGCDSSRGVTQRPATPPIIPTATISLPPGWYVASTPTGLGFTDGRGSTGLASSPTDPPEVAGCGLPALGSNAKAIPQFLLSMDAGHHWQTHAIKGVSPTDTCIIVADTRLPKTFVVQTGNDWATDVLMTRDNGITWNTLHMPSGLTVNLHGQPGFSMPTLVNGHLIADFLPAGQTAPFRLLDVSLSGGFKPLDEHLPQPPSTSGLPANTPPEAVTVDSTNPDHLYAAVYGAFGPNHNSGFRLYETRNAGVVWQDIHEWQTSLSLGIWASPDKRVYALDLQDTQPGLYSTSDGSTWQFTNINAGSLALSPSGLVVLIGDQNYTSFDPKSHHVSPLSTQRPDISYGSTLWVVIDRPTPAFLLVTNQGTFVRPFTPAH